MIDSNPQFSSYSAQKRAAFQSILIKRRERFVDERAFVF
jgi:hypothetical protein